MHFMNVPMGKMLSFFQNQNQNKKNIQIKILNTIMDQEEKLTLAILQGTGPLQLCGANPMH